MDYWNRIKGIFFGGGLPGHMSGMLTASCYLLKTEDNLSERVQMFEERIREKLRSDHDTELTVIPTDTVPTDPSKIIIIPCPVVGIPLVSAKRTLEDIKCHQKVVLVFFHPKDSPAKFAGNPDDSSLKEEFKELGLMIDVVSCYNEQGLYNDPTNEEEVNKLCVFLSDNEKVICFVRGDPNLTSLGIDKELIRRVESQMKHTHHIDVVCRDGSEKWKNQTAISVVLCPVSSRLASNAKHAMKDIEGHKNMALVFFHHVASHVSFNGDSESVLMDDEYRSLGAMIDVVFFHGEGMYECPANTRAIDKFCEFLKDRNTKENVPVSNQNNEDTPSDAGYQEIDTDNSDNRSSDNSSMEIVLHKDCMDSPEDSATQNSPTTSDNRDSSVTPGHTISPGTCESIQPQPHASTQTLSNDGEGSTSELPRPVTYS